MRDLDFELAVIRAIKDGRAKADTTPPYAGPEPDADDLAWASGDQCDRAADEHYDRMGWCA